MCLPLLDHLVACQYLLCAFVFVLLPSASPGFPPKKSLVGVCIWEWGVGATPNMLGIAPNMLGATPIMLGTTQPREAIHASRLNVVALLKPEGLTPNGTTRAEPSAQQKGNRHKGR